MKKIILLSAILSFGFIGAQQLLTEQFNSGAVQHQNGIYIVGETFNKSYMLSGGETLYESILMINLNGENMSVNDTEFSEIKVYPNPAKNRIYLNSQEQWKIEIYDLTGKLVLNSVGNNIDISQLSASVYILKGTSVSGKSFTKKIIVKH